MSCFHAINPEQGLFFSLFLAGLVGGFTHCVTMCGPFVLAQTEHKGCFQYKKLKDYALLPYHLGRMTTYVMIAVLFNTLFNIAFLSMPIKSFIEAPILFLTGVIFLVSAFPRFASLVPWVAKIRLPLPSHFFESSIRPLLSAPTAPRQYLLGLALGLMPCGLVFAALMAASMASTPLYAGLAMSGFALGTMPALLLLASGGQVLRQKFPKAFSNMQGGMMLLSGIWLCILAGQMIF
ncbi:MAG: sulfite exporter TauE/SafE family protein [Pseudomonadota bacterium]